MENVTIRKSDNAMLAVRELNYESDGGDIIYSAPQVETTCAHKEIQLTNGKIVIVDAEDYEWLNQYRWWFAKRRSTEYAQCRITDSSGKKKIILMHRMLMNTPLGLDTDHINGNGLDNRKSNLRPSTHRENMRNRRKATGYKGVYYRQDRGVYYAHIKLDRRKVLGHFTSEVSAACAYDYAAKEHFGEFACLNFPNGQPLTIHEVEQQRYKQDKTSIYRGVHWYKSRNKWQAKIMVNYKHKTLGYFYDEIEAAEAYNEAALRFHGEKAKLNTFSAPQKPPTPAPAKQILCTGRVAADVATLTVQLPVGLTPEAFIAYLKELFPPSFGMVVSSSTEEAPTLSDMDEMEFLSYSLELHRSGHTTPATRLNEEQLTAIEDERPGYEFSTKPWEW